MRTRLAASAALIGLAVLGAPSALAATADYSGGGEEAPTAVLPTTRTADTGAGAPTAVTPSTLPFTGGELVLISLAGAGAVAAGTVLVAGGRRRTTTA